MDNMTDKEKMIFDDFADELVEELRFYYINHNQKNVSVVMKEVKKNNDLTMHAVIINDRETAMIPSIYIDGIYLDYCRGMSIEACAEEVRNMYNQRVNTKLTISEEFFSSFESVKDSIYPKLINHDRNAQMLETVPHAVLGDLAMIFRIYVREFDGEGRAAVTVNKELADTWKVDSAQIYETAMNNLRNNGATSIRSLYSIASEIMLKSKNYDADKDILQVHNDDTPQMYVMTTRDRLNGAVGMVEDDKLSEFAEKLGTDLYILPSSVNEIILLPRYDAMDDAEILLNVVKEVNAREVPAEDFLSDNVYTFSRSDRALRFALTGEKISLQLQVA